MMLTQNNYLSGAAPIWSFLKGIGRSLGRFFFLNPADERLAFKKRFFVALEAGEVSCALGHRIFSRVRIQEVRKVRLDEKGIPQPEQAASTAALVLTEMNAGRPEITLGIPKSWAVVKTVKLPKSVLENLPDVMAYELDRLTPFSSEDAFYDYKLLKEEEDQVLLLLAASRADRIEPFLEAFREKGLIVTDLGINLLGMGTFCRYQNGDQPFVFLEVEEAGYEGAVFYPESTVEPFSGSFTNQDEKSKIDALLSEIKNLTNQNPLLQAPEVIFRFREPCPALREQLKLRLTQRYKFLDEMTKIPIPNQANPHETPYSAVGGLMEDLWLKSLKLNLLARGRQAKSRRPLAVSILLILGLLVLLGLYWITPIDIEKKKLANLEKQIAQKKVALKKVEALKNEIEAVKTEIQIIYDFKQSHPLALNIFRELTRVVPQNTWFTRLRITQNQVNIEGYSPSATVLVPRLEESKYFKKVEFAAPTFRDPKQNMDRFQIKMELEGGRV